MPPVEQKRMHIVGSHTAQAVSTSVVTVSAATGAKGILLQAIDGDVRFTLDGTDPVAATTGFLLYDGHDPLVVDFGDNVTSLKFVSDAGGACEVQYQFVR